MCELSLFSWQLHLKKATLDQILDIASHVHFHLPQYFSLASRKIAPRASKQARINTKCWRFTPSSYKTGTVSKTSLGTLYEAKLLVKYLLFVNGSLLFFRPRMLFVDVVRLEDARSSALARRQWQR